MSKHIHRTAVFLIVLLALMAALTACSSTSAPATAAQGQTQGQGQGRGPRQGRGQGAQGMADHPMLDVNALPGGELNEAEREGLAYMREEEKLAHDVYTALYEKWQLPIFDHIASSETRHTNMVLALIEKYHLDDPAAGKAPGEFSDPDLQTLYDQLVAQGSQSLEAALTVGGAIEEIDILDLQKHIAAADNEDIRTVYDRLMKGSENHLRAFTRVLAQETGETYQPQFMDKEAYEAIVSAAMGHGGYGQGQGHGHGEGRHGQGNHDENGHGHGQGHGNCEGNNH